MNATVPADAGAKILQALTSQSRAAFTDVVDDFDRHVLPTLAMISQSLVTVGGQLAESKIGQDVADIEVQMQIRAAAAVIVGFANTNLLQVQNLINGVLSAVRDVVNEALGSVKLLK